MNGRDIDRRLRQAGRSRTELAEFLSQKLGRTVSYKAVSRMATGENKRLGVEEAAGIEEFLAGTSSAAFTQPPDLFPLRPGRVPLYGLVAGASEDRIAIADDRILDHIDAPASNVDAAFRVIGDSMEPRLFAGEIVFVKLGVRPAKGDDVVVEMRDEQQGALIKTYVASKDGWVFLRQYNPDAEIRLKADQVRALHAVRLRG